MLIETLLRLYVTIRARQMSAKRIASILHSLVLPMQARSQTTPIGAKILGAIVLASVLSITIAITGDATVMTVRVQNNAASEAMRIYFVCTQYTPLVTV